MSNISRTLGFSSALFILLVSGCNSLPDRNDDDIAKLCKEYCRQQDETRPRVPTVDNSGLFVMVKNVNINGTMKTSPMRQIYLKSENPDTGDISLVTPHNPSYGNIMSEEGLQVIDKSVELDPTCFATKEFEPPNLDDIDLTYDNTTITLINFSEDGRVESLELGGDHDGYKKIQEILDPAFGYSPLSGSSEYRDIQAILSDMTPTDFDAPSWPQPNFPERDLIADNTPLTKTPFYSDLTQTNYARRDGHIYFYVLADKNMMFTRQYAALVTYAPEVEDTLMRLYAPFAQYPVYPKYFAEDKMDVLTFHFTQSPDAKRSEEKKECRYVYDLHVISIGQDESGSVTNSGTPATEEHSTPLFIDPEVKSEGVIIVQ